MNNIYNLSFIKPNTKLIQKQSIIKNINEIELVLGETLINYIKQYYFGHFYEVIRYVIRNNLNYEKLFSITKSDVNENKKKLFDGNSFRHDNDDANYIRGSINRGKKRPEHSKKLKNKPNYKNRKENWTVKRSEYDKEMNSIEWKRKVLINKGIFTDSLSDLKLIQLYNEYVKKRVMSNDYKITKIKNFLNRSKYKHMYDDVLLKELLTNNLEESYSIVNSIISTYHVLRNDNNMGGSPMFVRTVFNPETLPKCKNKNQFSTRSSYESIFINNFILENIENIDYWSFETEIFNIKNKLYIPDFIISINGEEYFIELKGYIRDESTFNKIEKISNYMGLNKKYIFLTNPNVTLHELLQLQQMEIYIKTHKQENIEPSLGFSIGLSREDIIKNLEPNSIFVNNGLFFYTVDDIWSELSFHVLIGDKCISEIIYDMEKKEIKSEHSTSRRFAEKLKENFNLHLNQLLVIQPKNKK